ncbi:MAG: hypothetical protein AB4426_23085, partial [Xenococcaceae cyanobacterium]
TLKIQGQAVSIELLEKNWLFITISNKLKGWLKIRLHRPLPDGHPLPVPEAHTYSEREVWERHVRG